MSGFLFFYRHRCLESGNGNEKARKIRENVAEKLAIIFIHFVYKKGRGAGAKGRPYAYALVLGMTSNSVLGLWSSFRFKWTPYAGILASCVGHSSRSSHSKLRPCGVCESPVTNR